MSDEVCGIGISAFDAHLEPAWIVLVLPDPCWLWTGRTGWNGYGRISGFPGISTLPHRVSFEIATGGLSNDLQLDHLCRTIVCVNPRHLEQVTAQENTLRSANPCATNAKLTHCKREHPFTPQNTRWRKNSRHCIACIKIRNAARTGKVLSHV